MNWNDIPSLAALRAFDALARHGSMTAAAQSLNVTHAAIAQHVRGLESHLGVGLTVRAGRGVELTAHGHSLADALDNGFGQIHAAIHRITQEQAARPLSVTATPSFAENWLLPRLGKFWAAYPDIMLSITPSVTVADLRRDPFDIAIRYGAGDWPDGDAAFLVSADYVVVAAPKVLEGKQANSIADLQDQSWLFETVYQEPMRWAIDNGLDPDCCKIKNFQTLNMALSALRAGVGVSVVSRALVERDLADGSLIAVTDVPLAGKGYYVLTPPGRLSKHARIFRKWIFETV